MEKGPCESCGELGAVITKGPFAGSRQMHDYCEKCSQDLCDSCLDTGKCDRSDDGKHHRPPEES